MPMTKYPMPRHVRLRLADAAQVEVRTLERYLLGLTTRDRGATRMDAALVADGWRRVRASNDAGQSVTLGWTRVGDKP